MRHVVAIQVGSFASFFVALVIPKLVPLGDSTILYVLVGGVTFDLAKGNMLITGLLYMQLENLPQITISDE